MDNQSLAHSRYNSAKTKCVKGRRPNKREKRSYDI